MSGTTTSTDWKHPSELLLDRIAEVRDEYRKLRQDLLDQMEWHASQGDSEETSHFSTEAERAGAALAAVNRIMKIATEFFSTPSPGATLKGNCWCEDYVMLNGYPHRPTCRAINAAKQDTPQ